MDKRHNLKMGDLFLDHLFNTPFKKKYVFDCPKNQSKLPHPLYKDLHLGYL
jgi:hypothetical protein